MYVDRVFQGNFDSLYSGVPKYFPVISAISSFRYYSDAYFYIIILFFYIGST